MEVVVRRTTSRTLLCFLLGAAAPAAAQQSPRLTPDLQQQLDTWFRRASRSAPGQWGVAVADERGRLIWGTNSEIPLIPASAVKLFTTGFARTVLGADARQVTRVVGIGYADPTTGTWVGSWSLELNGDPTLERTSRQGPMLRDLAAQLADQGIHRLSGPLRVVSGNGAPGASYPAAWSVRHRGRPFAPLVGAMTLNENLISFTIAPAPNAGESPRVVASMPDGMASLVTIRAKTVAGRSDRLRILAAGGGRYEVRGTIGVRARARSFTGTAQDLQLVLEAAWEAALNRVGIEWVREGLGTPETTLGQLTLAEVVSPPLDSIAAEVNTRSLNIGAEALLRWAGGGSEAADQLTRHVVDLTDDPGVRLVDGSGLSSDDRATAASFVRYLARFPTTPAGRNFPLLLPANGSGTLRRLASAQLSTGVVRAKTGTLGNVSSLVGYLGHKDGLLLISVLYNGSRVSTAKQQQWNLFRVLGAEGTMVPGEALLTEVELGGDPPGEIPPPPVPSPR